MSNNSEQELDWVNLPLGSEVESLWGCLHDGELISCRSDLIERVVTLEFNVRHLLEEPNSDVSFFLHLHNVESVRAAAHFRWPGQFFVPEGASREEECRLIDEYQAKWREESIGWLYFEGALSTDPLQISNADLIQSDSKVALKVSGHLDAVRFDDLYCSIYLRGNTVSASRSDGASFSLEQFMELGRRYWEEFSKRRQE